MLKAWIIHNLRTRWKKDVRILLRLLVFSFNNDKNITYVDIALVLRLFEKGKKLLRFWMASTRRNDTACFLICKVFVAVGGIKWLSGFYKNPFRYFLHVVLIFFKRKHPITYTLPLGLEKYHEARHSNTLVCFFSHYRIHDRNFVRVFYRLERGEKNAY